MNNYVELFLDMLVASRYAALNTVEAYKRDLAWFLQKINHKNPLQLSFAEIRDVLSQDNLKDFSFASRVRRISTIRQFYQFLYEQNYIEENPAELLESPKRNLSLPKVINESEVGYLLDYVKSLISKGRKKNSKNCKYKQYLRNYTILTILYSTGLRISELCSLKLSDINYTEKLDKVVFILIKGKGNKDRFVPLNQESQEAITSWLQLRNKIAKYKDNPYLFPSQGSAKYISRQLAARQIKALAKEAGLDNYEISPHIFRHSFATHLLNNGSDLRILQELLGHSNINTTQIYTHIMQDKLYKTVEQYHPLAHKQNTE